MRPGVILLPRTPLAASFHVRQKLTVLVRQKIMVLVRNRLRKPGLRAQQSWVDCVPRSGLESQSRKPGLRDEWAISPILKVHQ